MGMGYLPVVIIKPTRANVKDATSLFSSSGGLYGMLAFYGHANSSDMSWNYMNKGGEYSVGITTSASGIYGNYEYININRFKIVNAGFVLFMGCNTASGIFNLPQAAVDNGARSAVGFNSTIYEGDTDKWNKRFYENLATGVSINSAIRYANSFSDYIHPSNIKSTREYGYTAYKPKTNTSYTMSTIDKTQIIDSISYELLTDYISIETISDYIRKSYNEDFALIDYEYSYTESSTEKSITKIYDFNLLINGLPSNVGYTVMVDENSIQIINNMKSFDKQSIKNEKDLIENTIKKYKSNNNNMEIEFESTKKYFNIDTNKSYLDINIIEKDKISGVKSILTETFEI